LFPDFAVARILNLLLPTIKHLPEKDGNRCSEATSRELNIAKNGIYNILSHQQHDFNPFEIRAYWRRLCCVQCCKVLNNSKLCAFIRRLQQLYVECLNASEIASS